MPLNPTKITPPVYAHVLHRRRLHERLDAASQKRVVLVMGQAAQGKSTLVADYLAQQNTPAAWLHLDPLDTDHVNFYLLLVSALTVAFKDIPAEVHLVSHPVTLGPKAGRQRYRERIRRLLADSTHPFNLVIDGMECLPPDAPALQLIDWILECLPPEATAYLISRSQPSLRLSRFKVRQEMICITNADLAFSQEEIEAFFHHRLAHRMHRKDITDIHRATEGWVGGLVLVAEMLAQATENDTPPRLKAILEQSFQDEALAFFSEEIFAALPEGTRALLTAAALLETIDPCALDGVVDSSQAETILGDLVRRNLFIQAVYDPVRGTRYRLHQLFRDFLRARFQISTTPERQRRLLSRIADNLDRMGHVEDAIDFFHRAGRHEALISAIKKIGTDLVIRGRTIDLHRYLCLVPASPALHDTWLEFYRILCRRLRKGPGEVDAFTAVNEAFTKEGDIKGTLLASAYRIESAIFAGLQPDKVLAWISEAESLLETLRGRRYFAYAKTVLWMQIGFGAIVSGGHTRRGIAACEQARRMAERIGETTLRSNAAVIGVFGYITAGDFSRASSALAAAEETIDKATYPEYRALRHFLGLELMLIEGRFNEADTLVSQLQEEIDTNDLLFIYPLFMDQLGRFSICRGDLTAAQAHAQHLSDIAAMSSNPLLEALSLRLAGAVRYHQGRNGIATGKLAAAEERFAAHDPDCHHAVMVRAMTEVVGRHNASRSGPAAHLTKALSVFTQPGNAAYAAEIHLALALSTAHGDDAAMKNHLETGFSLITDAMGPSFLLLSRRDFLDACMLATTVSPSSATVSVATAAMQRVMASLPSEEASALLGEIGEKHTAAVGTAGLGGQSADSPLLHIRTFGGFSVKRSNGTAIADRDWGGGKPRSLLKAIIVHGVRDVPREMLLEDLWPESPPEAGGKRFKVTLHRLRKVLEPDLPPGRGSRYIHLNDNRVSLDPALCQVDVKRFLDTYKTFSRSRLSADGDAMMRAGHTAVEIYQGEFLPEEPYAPWVDIKRAALRDQYLDMLQVLGDRYRQQGDSESAVACFQAVVHTDPGVETAQRVLMSLYLDLGRRRDAIRTYETYRDYADTFLGIPPEDVTTALYHRIVDRNPTP